MNARFVVLHHTGIDEPHFDLMFDTGDGGRLVTWRSPIWPIDHPTVLVRLDDHRREYLTYEGEVSGKRGRVDRVAEGACEVEVGEKRWSLRYGKSAMIIDHIGINQWQATSFPLFFPEKT